VEIRNCDTGTSFEQGQGSRVESLILPSLTEVICTPSQHLQSASIDRWKQALGEGNTLAEDISGASKMPYSAQLRDVIEVLACLDSVL
jgi:hypothetical protein